MGNPISELQGVKLPWLSGSMLVSINVVTLCHVRLVLG